MGVRRAGWGGGVGWWQKDWTPSHVIIGWAQILVNTSFAMKKNIKLSLNSHQNLIFDSFLVKRNFCNRDGFTFTMYALGCRWLVASEPSPNVNLSGVQC